MRVWQHFKTITRHKLLVMKYCFKMGLYWQGLVHDLSKYSWTEFSVGCRYYQGDRSPNNAEREATGLSTSWIHHYGRNKHHFEHWVDYGIDCDTVIQGCLCPGGILRRWWRTESVPPGIIIRIPIRTGRLWIIFYGARTSFGLYMKVPTEIWNCFCGCWPRRGKRKH